VTLSRSAALAIALAWVAAGTAQTPPARRLPDLNQIFPQQLRVETDTSSGSPRYRIGFLSAVINQGAGPLILRGRRASPATAAMTADQVVQRSDGSEVVRPAVGRLVYVNAITHQHWHLVGFDRYELRRPKGYKLVAPDRKSGFCLGDRYDAFAGKHIRAQPAKPVYTGNCAPNDPSALGVTEGISTGYGDDYPPIKEGQYLDVTHVRAGRYYLVHRTNADRSLVESDYSNDAASLLVSLTWPHGRHHAPRVKTLRTCQDSDRCPR
jgi:hypothetical protein